MRLAAILVGQVLSLSLLAQDTRTVTEPSFPQPCIHLPAQLTAGPSGLALLDEATPDTSRVQSALNACAAGQAVELQRSSAANAFLTGPLKIPAGVTLLIDPGVTLFASRNPRDYDSNATHSCGTLAVVTTGCVPFITVDRADGSGIMGFGSIDGRGHLPMLVDGRPSNQSWWDLARSAVSPLGQNNPRLLNVTNTNAFTLYKITLRNAPNFHVALGNDTNVTIWGIKIITPFDARNTDGVDPGYSSNVTITKSFISDGDDNIAVGASNNPGAMNISVVDNHFGDGHGASIGSYTQTGVANILFDHISFNGDKTNSNAAGIRIKSDISRGGLVQNVTYSNLCLRDVRAAIVLDPFYTAGATGSKIPQFRDIVLRNVHATTEGTVKIDGYDGSSLTTLTLDNVQIDGVKSSDISAQYANVGLGPGPSNFGSLVKGKGVSVSNNVANSDAPFTCPAELFTPLAGEFVGVTGRVRHGRPFVVTAQILTTKAISYAAYQARLKADPNATLSLPAPTGSVEIYDGDRLVGIGILGASEFVDIWVEGLAAGSHTLIARYLGDANYSGITFGALPVAVRGPKRALSHSHTP